MAHWWRNTIILCIGVFLINYTIPSDLNNWATQLNFSPTAILNDSLLEADTQSRLIEAEFGRRPLLVNLLKYGKEWTGISQTLLFCIYQAFGYLLVCYLLQQLAWHIDPTLSWASTILPYALLFPSVFLFVAHAHTYDDLFQYAAILGFLYYGLKQMPFPAAVLLCVGCIIRETSVLFLPVYVAMFWNTPKLRNSSIILLAIAAFLIACTAVYLYAGHELIAESYAINTGGRWTNWKVNFADYAAASEVIWLTLFILGPSAFIVIRNWPALTASKTSSVLIYCYVYLVATNTLLVYLTAYAREARLLLLPNLIVFFLLAPFWQQYLRVGKQQYQKFNFSIPLLLLLIILVPLSYIPSVGGTGYIYRFYALLWTIAMMTLYKTVAFAKCRIRADQRA